MSVLYDIQLQDLGVQQTLAGLDARAGDLSPLMDDIGAHLEQMARDRIENTNVGPDGQPWPVSLRAELDGGKTLFESGQLAASLTHLAGRDFAQIGSNLIYAGVHQEGAIITGKNGGPLVFKLADGQLVEVQSVEIPARPYLGVSEDDQEEILALTADYLLAPVRAIQ